MAFQLKDFRSITRSMINWMRASTDKITDYGVGSVARTMLEAPAAELDQLYQEMFHAIAEAIPAATYRSFDFQKLPAHAASGEVTFTASTPATSQIVIPAGTRVKNSAGNVVYETQVDGVIDIGETQVTVLVVATVAGAAGNALPGTITQIDGAIVGVDSVTNLSAFTNGRDEETEDERKVRFQSFISTLPRGTLSAIRYGASTTRLMDENGLIIEFVRMVEVIEPFRETGTGEIALIEVYIHNGVSGASPALVAETQKVIDGYRREDGTTVPGWKAAGVRCVVYPATEVSQDVVGVIRLAGGYEADQVIPRAERSVRDYLTGLGIGATSVLTEIIRIIKSVDGVYDVELVSPTANLEVSKSEKIVPGTIELTV